MSSEWYNTKRMPAVFFELIPQSCYCPPNLNDVDSKIKFVKKLDEIAHYASGNFRLKQLNVYSITDDDGTVSLYYFIFFTKFQFLVNRRSNNLAMIFNVFVLLNLLH